MGKTEADYAGWAAPQNPIRLQVKPGDTVASPVSLPVGTVVTLTEDASSANPAVPDVTWSDPQFAVKDGESGNSVSFTIENKTQTAVNLTNEATKIPGSTPTPEPTPEPTLTPTETPIPTSSDDDTPEPGESDAPSPEPSNPQQTTDKPGLAQTGAADFAPLAAVAGLFLLAGLSLVSASEHNTLQRVTLRAAVGVRSGDGHARRESRARSVPLQRVTQTQSARTTPASFRARPRHG